MRRSGLCDKPPRQDTRPTRGRLIIRVERSGPVIYQCKGPLPFFTRSRTAARNTSRIDWPSFHSNHTE